VRVASQRGSGLEHLLLLRRLELDHNQLAKKENLGVLGMLPALAHVTLQGNAALGDYRLSVILCTMYLAGTNRAPGLITLDARRVTIGVCACACARTHICMCTYRRARGGGRD
jgi:hypothetical protein